MSRTPRSCDLHIRMERELFDRVFAAAMNDRRSMSEWARNALSDAVGLETDDERIKREIVELKKS